MDKAIHLSQLTLNNSEYGLSFHWPNHFSLLPGDYIRIVGQNGTGKTALFKIFEAAKEQPSFFNPRSYIFYVPQNYEDFSFFGRKIHDFVNDYLTKNRSITMIKDYQQIMDDFFKHHEQDLAQAFVFQSPKRKPIPYELNILLNQSLDKLSGGQKRLLYLIREILALKISPREQQKILFLDEPFNDIDLKNLSFIKRMINDVRKEIPSLIIIMCTHLQLVDGLNRVLKLTRNASIVSIEEIINAQEKHEAIRNRYDHQNE
jgi:ABC-type Mn2+/Zn2+ transport system ATPase subunit